MADQLPNDATRIAAGKRSVADLNSDLRKQTATSIHVAQCQGQDYLASGLSLAYKLRFEGNLGDFCCVGLSDADIVVKGNVGHGFAEAIASGLIQVRGHSGDALAAFGRGGLVCVRGDAQRRCAVGLEGAEVIVTGNVGLQAGFAMRSGTLIIGGSAEGNLGERMQGGTIYVAGDVASVGPHIEEDRLRETDRLRLSLLFLKAGLDAKPGSYRPFRPLKQEHA